MKLPFCVVKIILSSIACASVLDCSSPGEFHLWKDQMVMGKQCEVVVEGVCQVTPLGLFVLGVTQSRHVGRQARGSVSQNRALGVNGEHGSQLYRASSVTWAHSTSCPEEEAEPPTSGCFIAVFDQLGLRRGLLRRCNYSHDHARKVPATLFLLRLAGPRL